MVLLSVFALNLLPIHYTAVLLLVAALVFILLEAKFGGHGALALPESSVSPSECSRWLPPRCRRWPSALGSPGG